MDMENKIKEICSMQETIISCLKSEICSGLMNVDSKEAGEAADIIKDFSEAEKNMWEAKYYKLVCEAMEEKDDGNTRENRYGYTPRIRGNFNMGYNKPMVDQEPYIRGYLHDPNFEDNMRQGYNEYGVNGSNSRQGYSEYGKPYNEYMTARRHYTQTKSMEDKTRMDSHAKEHLDQTIETIEDIWSDASPELKVKMKSELKTLMDSMM